MSLLQYGTAESRIGSLNWRLEIKRLEAARRAAQLLGGLVFAAVLLIAIGDAFGLLIANTDSAAPAGLYRIAATRFRRGDLVAACLPIAIAQEGLARGYLRTGACPGGAEPVGKIACALPGDSVEIEPRFVAVNGVRFANSAMATHDSAGRSLPHMAWGKHIVAPNDVWLFGFNDRRSWDSRYFGPVPLAHVRGQLAPVLTW
jgi:conjugative transfer signal peptidase TraF